MYNMYNPQAQLERWNKIKQDAENEIARLTQQPPAINQNFNIVAPSNNNDFDAKFVNSFDEVKKLDVNKNTIFMNTNEPIFYMKMTDGEIKSYKFEEIVILDERDKKIMELEQKLEILMREGVNNGKSINEFDEPKSDDGNINESKSKSSISNTFKKKS